MKTKAPYKTAPVKTCDFQWAGEYDQFIANIPELGIYDALCFKFGMRSDGTCLIRINPSYINHLSDSALHDRIHSLVLEVPICQIRKIIFPQR